MFRAQRLKRVFGIDIETCPACGAAVRIIPCIEDTVAIEKILTHLNRARCGMRNLLEWIGRASSDGCRSWRGLKY